MPDDDKRTDPQMRILIVDDDTSSRSLMGVFLADYGQCCFAENGTDALAAVSKAFDQDEPFDLICLDIMMPEIDGLETLKRIRDLETSRGIKPADQTKVLMTTTASQKATVMRAFHYGCSGYLVKPISKDAIVKEMNKLPFEPGMFRQWRQF